MSSSYRSWYPKGREKNLGLLLIAVLLALIFWGSVMALAKLAIFLLMVYAIYSLLKSRF